MSREILLVSSVLLALLPLFVAHPVCRSCTKHCFQNSTTTSANGTEVDDLLAELQGNRIKRSADGEVEFRACQRFQIEMLLIPLSIAMIPLGLTALILCTCCCGPKDSRGKLPDDILSHLPMSKKRRVSSEEFELEFKDGYVQRKDSARTKFSTVISYIEARRESVWSTRSQASQGEPSLPSPQPASTPSTEAPSTATPSSDDTPNDCDDVATPKQHERLKKVASCDSKRTRFSDTVSVISVDSLSRRC